MKRLFLSNGMIKIDVEQVVQPSPNAVAKDTITYTYDADGHLTSEYHDVGSNGVDSNDWQQIYTYDLDGNRLSMSRFTYPTSGGSWQVTNTATYVYNAENQLTEQDGWALGNIGPDVTTFIYNPDGTLKEQDVNGGVNNDGDGKGDDEGSDAPSTVTYTYDLRGWQTSEYEQVQSGTNTTTLSAYDTSGNRIMEGSNYFLVDENNPTGYSQVLEERDGSQTAALARSYVIGLDVVGQTIGNPTTANAVEYILSDGNRSTRQLVNSSGVIQSDWSYDSFGNITGGYNQAIYTGGGRGQPLTYLGPTSDVGFQGGYANPDGSIYFRARNYNPVTGRFNNSDPIGNTFGPGDIANSNLYLFVNDDPRNAWDPSGHFAELDVLATAGIADFLMGIALIGMAVYGSQDVVSLQTSTSLDMEMSFALGAGQGTLYSYWVSPMYHSEMVQAAQTAEQQAIKSTTLTQQQVDRLPVFFVFKSGPLATPGIWNVDETGMQRVPSWVVLNYLGPGNPQAAANRNIAQVYAQAHNTPSSPTNNSLDEYPFASVREGGGAGNLHPEVAYVPLSENRRQGGMLSSFYQTQLQGTTTFLVALVP